MKVEELNGHLLKRWPKIHSKLMAGTYLPSPVKLGIPTVSDRIAQEVVKSRLEPAVDPLFHPDSYGYRPGKSALGSGGAGAAAMLAL